MPQLHDEAAEEFAEAAAYYERRLPGLGDRFIHEIVESLSRVDDMPEAGSPGQVEGSPLAIRRMPVRSFPYHLVYITEPTLVVVAVAHDRQRPGYWADRVPLA
jgi:ParE toxin of type II toxin-antitoxin system, parDE